VFTAGNKHGGGANRFLTVEKTRPPKKNQGIGAPTEEEMPPPLKVF